jgi:hypothetical protein
MKDVRAMVDESAKSLATCGEVVSHRWSPFRNIPEGVPYLGDAADVLVAVLLGEAEVLVEAEAHVVAVEPVRGQPDVQQVLLQGRSDGGLARGREPREPDGEATLAAELVALVAREGGMPGDVAVAVVVVC